MLKGWAKHLLLAREKTVGDHFRLVPASDDASFTTGTTIMIDGGASAMTFGGTRDF